MASRSRIAVTGWYRPGHGFAARPNPPLLPRSEQHLLATWSPEGWRYRVRHAHHLRLLQVQEIPFALQAAGVAGQLPGASDDPVARNENG